MNWPQITVIIYWLLILCIKATMHDKPLEGKHNFMLYLMATIISGIVLFCGGFFKL